MSISTSSTPTSTSPVLSLTPFSGTSHTRLQALYSDFSRQKHSNPVSFQANVEWWRKALEAIVSFRVQQGNDGMKRSRLVLHANANLVDRVKLPRVGKPLALGIVLTDLRNQKSFIPLSEFMALKTSLYDSGSLPFRVASYVIGKPLWWALEHMGVVGEEGILSSSSRDYHKGTDWWGEYVVVSLVEKAADAALERQREKHAGAGDALYTLQSFRKTFAGTCGNQETLLNEGDTKVLLKFLERDRGVLIYDRDVIKFADPDASADSRTITAVDRGILELKTAVHNLHVQVDSLQNKIDECTKQASGALLQKRKPVALNYIRSRKQLHELLEKRLSSLNNLETTLITVEAAAGDVEIMKSYESSTATLKAILAHPSLQRDNIDRTMEALGEANADAREVDDAMRIGGDVALGVADTADDAELEEEWEALVKEVEHEKEEEGGQDTKHRLEDESLTPPDVVPLHQVQADSGPLLVATSS